MHFVNKTKYTVHINITLEKLNDFKPSSPAPSEHGYCLSAKKYVPVLKCIEVKAYFGNLKWSLLCNIDYRKLAFLAF